MRRIQMNELQNKRKSKRREARTDSSEKFARAEYQICQAALGDIESLVCPYCSSIVAFGDEKLCCVQMGEAAERVLHGMEAAMLRETGALADHTERPESLATPATGMSYGASNFVQ